MPILSMNDIMASIIPESSTPEIKPNVKTIFFMRTSPG
jgi:hypothetical protein